MATAYKVLGQQYPAANTATTLYSVPSATSTVVSTINIANLSTSDGDLVSVAIRPSGATLANQHYICKSLSMPAASQYSITSGITLAATDVITVISSKGLTSFSAFGSEIS